MYPPNPSSYVISKLKFSSIFKIGTSTGAFSCVERYIFPLGRITSSSQIDSGIILKSLGGK